MKVKILSISAVYAFLLVGCGGGSSTSNSDSSPEATVLTGVFVDSPVEGATFATNTQSGTTNASGEFSYLANEQVTFSIGATLLPAVNATAQVSPVDMAASSSNPTATTTNIARLLQSLDQDGNPDNGITIPTTAAASATRINFDVSTDAFENDQAVINLVANSGSLITTLISAEEANAHLSATLSDTSLGDTIPKVIELSLTEGVTPVLTVKFSIDMTPDYKTEGEYVPARTYWRDLKTFIVEFESVQLGGSIRLIPEFFISVTGKALAEGVEVEFTGESVESSEDDPSFNANTLIAGSPWYSIRVYEGRLECGNRYSYAADGSLSALSNGATITGTYTLSDTGLLSSDTVQFGKGTRQLNTLSQDEWTSDSVNNSNGEYLERAFSSRSSALAFANSLGTNCESELAI